jgi:alanine-synthesizing transaminase
MWANMVVECSRVFREWMRETSSETKNRQMQILEELVREGRSVIDLAYGSVPRYKELVNAVATNHLIQAAKEEWGTYPGVSAPPGVKEDARYRLRQAVSGFLERYCGVKATPEHVIIGHGTSGIFSILHLALLNPGDEICAIEPSHYFLEERASLSMLQAQIVTVPSDPNQDWEPDLEELRAKINKRTKAVVVNHPTNPTGVIYSERTLKQLIDIAGEHGLPVISDEMYQLITFDGLKAKSTASIAQDVPVIVTGSMSKFFMKPGWCTGYAYFQNPKGDMKEFEDAAKFLSNTPGFGGTRMPTPILVAAARTYEDSMNHCFEAFKKLQRNVDFTYKRLNEIDGISLRTKPQSALYALFRVDEIDQQNSRWSDDYAFACDLLKKEGIWLYPGSEFGDSSFGHSRTLLYRNMTVLEEAYDRLERFMNVKE